MRFNYYVIDVDSGTIFGVEDDDEAVNYAGQENCYVIKAKSGEWLQYDGELTDIVEGD